MAFITKLPEYTGDFFYDTLSPGQLFEVTGTMRSGKTNFTTFLIERALTHGYHIYTNINFYPENEIDEAKREGILDPDKEYYSVHPNIHFVTTASDLIIKIYKTKKNLIVLDEAQLYAGSARGNAIMVRWFKEFVTQMGKLRGAMILITQVKSELAVMLKKKLPLHEATIEKRSWDNRIVDIFFVPPQLGDEPEDPICIKQWGNIPPSNLPYDHESPAMFKFDIDMELFLENISKLRTLQVRKKGVVQKIVEDLLVDINEKKTGLSKTGIAKEIFKVNPKARNIDIAEILNCSTRIIVQAKSQVKTSHI